MTEGHILTCEELPIKTRHFDKADVWFAWREGTDEDGPHGEGKSKEEAIADLLEQERR